MEYTITTRHPDSRYGNPVCICQGNVLTPKDAFRAVCEELNLRQKDATQMLFRSLPTISQYSTGKREVPASVWNILRDELEDRGKHKPYQG